jgi:sugar-specific transcriptional regulator TrmB
MSWLTYIRVGVCPVTDRLLRDRMSLAHYPTRTMEEVVDQLIEYGLSKNEAKVVTFLAKRGAERASVVAQALKLNRTETYRTLRNLQRRGLVEASLEQPVRFQAAPFSRCLEVLIAERKNRLAALEERSGLLEHAFENISVETGAPAFERFQVLEGRARIGQKLLFMCENSKLQIDSIMGSSDLAGGSGRVVLDTLSMLVKRGRKIRIITDINPATIRLVEPFQSLIAFRHLDLTQRPVPRVSIIDDTEALFGIGGGEEAGGRESERVTLWISSRSFVRNLRAYFNEMWSSATPALARLETIKAGKPEEDLKILKGRLEVRHRLSEMMNGCRETIDFWTTMKGIEILANHRLGDLDILRKRNVRIRIIAPIMKENRRSAKMLLQVAELRHSEALGPARIVIADRDNLLYYQRIPDDDSLEAGADVGFWTNSHPLIETMSRAYEEVWKGMVAIYTPHRHVSRR